MNQVKNRLQALGLVDRAFANTTDEELTAAIDALGDEHRSALDELVKGEADAATVREAVTHGETGMLVDFFDPDALAAQVVDVVANPGSYAHLGPNARAHVVETYDFLTRCLPEHIAQINALVPEEKRIRI